MEQKDFDIYEILKGAPVGTPLYTPMCGNVLFSYLASNKEAGEAIWTNDKNGEYSFNKNGRWMEGGEVMLFPSKKMRDWRKLYWKKGDVLVSNDRRAHIIFEKFTDYTYTKFAGKHYCSKDGKKGYYYVGECNNAITECFGSETEDGAKTYISAIEKMEGGKLNRETLEIENEKFVTDQAFDLRISVHEELREATEGEAVTFQEACTLWEKSKKQSKEQGEEQPAFKPFDKVLVRNGKRCDWLPAFFVRDRGEDFAWRYKVLLIHSGKSADFLNCIPFDGNEYLAFTDNDFVDLPF